MVGSIEPEKDKRIQQNKEKYLEIARSTEMAITELSAEKIWSNWDSPKTDEWRRWIAGLYFNALNHCVEMGDSELDVEKKAQLKHIIASYCENFAESHWGIFQTFLKEISDLMEVKGVCI